MDQSRAASTLRRRLVEVPVEVPVEQSAAACRRFRVMPTYEFRCRTCDDTFEVRRPMHESGDPAACPGGHDDTVRLLSVFARTGGSTGVSTTPMTTGGGCCGGGCGCAH